MQLTKHLHTPALSQKHSSNDIEVNNDATSPPPPRDIHGIKWSLVVVSLISVTFLWGLDGTIVADIQATFVREFQSIEKLAYNSVAFFLGAAATVLSWGQVYGQFNAKWVFITCIVTFEAGSALCGAAPNIEALIAGRTICGIGGSGMYTGVLTLLSLTTTEQERALYMGIPGLTWGAGTVLGPVIGGAFAESSATWRYGFYINLFIGALFAPVYLVLIPSKDPRPGTDVWTRLRNIDLVGFTLLAGTTTTLTLAMCFGGLTYSWNSAQIIALFVVSGFLLLMFITQQSSGALVEDRVFPLAMMKNWSILIIFLNETFSATSCFLPCYFIPLYFQYVRNESPLMAGVHLLPFIVAMVATVMACGALVSFRGHWMPWFFYGGALVLAGGALMYTVDENTSTSKIYGYSILIGSGTGAFIQMPFNAAQEFVSPSQIPAAVGLITWAQLAAPAITLSIANSVFLNRAKVALGMILPPDAPLLSIVSGVGKEYLDKLDQETKSRVIHAIVHSMAKSYILIICAGGLTLVLTVFLLVTKTKAK
ncbi:putative major facilitator superfamily transporter [Byssothecium circinans]|uniref:Putative major facilitator superfamily transporter n=1 Tax=Byssothecium circinans TaxID=147558 RepID=A0A6A5TLU1_9PLEO|nr:putative major facilitator superfamily transporter [Byssothecium circinans]